MEIQKILTILEQLKADGTLVSIQMPDRNYQNITVITDIVQNGKQNQFYIDIPAGFKEVAITKGGWRLSFEFTGRDKVKYSFQAKGQKILQDQVLIDFPEAIDRKQRRENFRVKPPMGTYFDFTLKDAEYKASVINISLCGALIIRTKGIEKKPLLRLNQTLKNARVWFTVEEEQVNIKIRKAIVRRIEEGPEKTRYRYAFQFIDIDKENSQILLQNIYQVQRDMLLRKKLTQS
jgi:c-di-GMP-binding flagellar brake protein YcgR